MTQALRRLQAAFRKPGPEFGPLAFWFWNGGLEEAELGRQIREFVKQGVHGGFMHARQALRTPYLGDRWWDAVSYSVRKGAEAGFKTWIYDEYAWPSGRAGSPGGRNGQTPAAVLAAGPEHHAKTLVRNIHEVEGPAQVSLEGRFPAGTPVVRVAARLTDGGGLDPSSFTDLTKESTWSCPEGTWRIISFAVSTLDDHIDYLRSATVKLFLETTYEAYAERFASEFGKTIPGVFFDEPYIASAPLPWTDDLPEKFKKLKGYTLLDKLPMLLFRAGPETVKLRCDFYDVVATLYEEAWFVQISDWCERHGLLWTGHTEEHVAMHPARQGDYFRTLRHLSIPGTDMHSFRFARPRTVQPAEIKSAVSIAAMHDRPRVMAEAFGGAGWSVTLDEVRHGAGLLAALGIDMPVLHGFFYALDRADEADDWPNSFFFQNPYWEHFHELSNYIARLSAVVNQTTATTGVGVLYPLTSVSANTADGRPNARARRIAQVFEGLIDELFARQVDVHVVDETFVSDARLDHGVLRQGKLAIDTLLLPPLPVVRRSASRRMLAFARSGGRVIALGETPSSSSDAGASDRSVIRAMRDLFGKDPTPESGQKVGSGRSYVLPEDLEAALDDLVGLLKQGAKVTSKSQNVILVSRSLAGADVLLLVNGATREQNVGVECAASGAAELWDPETGDRQALAVSGARGHRKFEVLLPARSTRVVVFDNSARAPGGAKRAAGRSRVRRINLGVDWQFVIEKGVETGQGSVRRLELPVMRFADFSLGQGRLEKLRDPEYDDSGWGVLWLTCPTSEVVGNWRGSWITGVRKPQGWVVMPQSSRLSRQRLTKTVTINEPPIKAWATFVGVERATVYMNGTPLGESQDWTNPVTYNIMPYLRLGENTIVADVECTGDDPISFLFESQIDLRSGESVVVVSDQSWEVAAPRSEMWAGTEFERDVPVVTWTRGQPPVAPWGHIPLLGEPVRFPRTLMYRQNLPVGCVGIAIPSLKGVHKVYVDVRERTPDINGIYNITTGSLLSVEIEAADFSNGILAPLTLYTRPTNIKLAPWGDLGYGWYSGVSAYERSFELTDGQAASTVLLDLGDVRHHAEVIVNQRRVGVRLWPPYTFDISDAVQTGSNTVRVRVSNLLANEMRWKRDESRMSDPWHRYWHEDNIEPESLVSGMLGPVILRIG